MKQLPPRAIGENNYFVSKSTTSRFKMQSLKTVGKMFSNISRLPSYRSIFMSSRNQAESPTIDGNQEEITDEPISVTSGVGIEKSKWNYLLNLCYCVLQDLLYVICFVFISAINSVTLLGRVGSNPVKRGSVEHPVVTFSLATNSNYSYSNGWLIINDSKNF